MRDPVAQIAPQTNICDGWFEIRGQSGFPFNRATHTLAFRCLAIGFPASDNRISYLCNARHLANFMDPHDIDAHSDGERGRGRIALDPVVRLRVKNCADERFS